MRGSSVLSVAFLVVVAGMTIKPTTILFSQCSTANAAQLVSSEDATARDAAYSYRTTVVVQCPRSVSSLCLGDHLTQGLDTGSAKLSYSDRFKQWGATAGNYCLKQYEAITTTLHEWLPSNWSGEKSHAQVARKEKPAVNPHALAYLATEPMPWFCKLVSLASDCWLTSTDIPLVDHAESFFTEVPYFEQYGYRYVMEDTSEEDASDKETGEDTEDTFTKPQVPDFVLHPINGVIMLDDDEEKDGEAYEDDETYEEGDEPYRSYVPEDYAIEYEEYEVDELNGPSVDESQDADTDSTPTTPDRNNQASFSTPSGSSEVDYEPLRDEADYYHEVIEILEEEPLSSDPSGSFDIYWETTDPGILYSHGQIK